MATPPPSQFAALLRRSKFASFDPSVGQVYTTFDGHAARGNFGLKRPLALRRRNAHITVQAIDSREQQTVWRSAEPENRWIRMWDETGTTPTLTQKGSWHTRLGPHGGAIQFAVDSELAPRKEHTTMQEEAEEPPQATEYLPRSEAMLNFEAMSPKVFDHYLRRLRKLRPTFREYLRKTEKRDESQPEPSLLTRSSRPVGTEFKEFLAHQAYLEYRAPRPRHIEQQPHRYAGLTYTRSTPLQTQLTTKPHIGRILGDKAGNQIVVATAGMTSTMKRSGHDDRTPPVTTYRFSTVQLVDAPKTVGTIPEGLEGVKMKTTVRVDSAETRQVKDNPHPPGSKAYITHFSALSPVVNMTAGAATRDNFNQSEKPGSGKKLLDSLWGLASTNRMTIV
ncbi:mitochondrial ribosomal protein subunit-domain-containing protein [Trametes punicea]|nr:mitochondrial ribosomal protein subunit-domain-containing protein [Trametes punicea]